MKIFSILIAILVFPCVAFSDTQAQRFKSRCSSTIMAGHYADIAIGEIVGGGGDGWLSVSHDYLKSHYVPSKRPNDNDCYWDVSGTFKTKEMFGGLLEHTYKAVVRYRHNTEPMIWLVPTLIIDSKMTKGYFPVWKFNREWDK